MHDVYAPPQKAVLFFETNYSLFRENKTSRERVEINGELFEEDRLKIMHSLASSLYGNSLVISSFYRY